MSYARFSSTCDVYVYQSCYPKDGLVCCGCRLEKSTEDERGSFNTLSRAAMVKHMEDHTLAGHYGTEKVINRLADEIEQVGDSTIDIGGRGFN